MANSIDVTAKTDKQSGLLRSSIAIAAATMLSRILGLVRDIVIAVYFGSKAEADAFFVAFKIPNFLRRLFAEGAFSQAFVPLLSEYKVKYTHDKVKQFVNEVSGTLMLFLLGVTSICMVASPWLIVVFAPGFSNDLTKLALATELLRITFPYLLFISLTAFASAILNSYNQFVVPAITPVLLNLSLIAATLWLSPLMDEPIVALGWGVVIAGISQLLLQLPFLYRFNLLPRPRWAWCEPSVQRIIKLMIPALFGVSVSQVNLLLDTVLASLLQTGSVSWLYYADRLSELPLGIFAIAISTVILPSLSRSHAKTDLEAFKKTLSWAISLVLLIALPASLALFLLAKPLIVTLFYYGEMKLFDVGMSAVALCSYSVGLTAFMLIKVLAPGYFAQQDIKTPVTIGIKAMVVNMILNLILIWPLQHAGLALATSIAAIFNTSLLLHGLIRKKLFELTPSWFLYVGKLIVANGIMLLALYQLNPNFDHWVSLNHWQRVFELFRLVGYGIVAYGLGLLLMGIRPKQFTNHLH